MNINELIEKYSLPSPPSEAHYTVYKLTDPFGKVYIGCTGKPVKERWKKGRGYSKDTPIRRAIDEIGWENFRQEILCEHLFKAGAEKLERWLSLFMTAPNLKKDITVFWGDWEKVLI